MTDNGKPIIKAKVKINITKRSGINNIVKQDANQLLEIIITKYIDDDLSLEEILDREAPTDIRHHDNIKTTYTKLNTDKFRDAKQILYEHDALRELETNNRLVMKAPTGFGKTVLLYKILNILLPKLNIILWLTPRRNLNLQANDTKYTKYLKSGIYETYNYSPESNLANSLADSLVNNSNSNVGGDSIDKFLNLLDFITETKKKGKKAIIFVCYQSCPILIPKLHKYDINIDLVVCDEAHTIESWALLKEEHMKLLLKPDITCPNSNTKFIDKIIFTTATPKNGMVNDKYKPIFGNLIEHVQVYELIQKGILCNFEVIIKKMEDLPDDKEQYILEGEGGEGGEEGGNHNIVLKKPIVKRTIRKKKLPLDLCKFVVDSMQTYNKKKGVIYFNTQSRCKAFYKKMRQLYPEFKAFIYISDTKNITDDKDFNRDDTRLKKFEDCVEPCIIINCNKLSYGYDNVLIDLICLGDSRESEVEIRQILGRGLRNNIALYPNKVLHVLIPIYKYQVLDENENITADGTISKKHSKNDLKDIEMNHEVIQFEPLRAFLLFILSECGKDIINGRIGNKLDDEDKLKSNPNSIPFTKSNEDDEETVKIPPEICKELCSTGYGKYSRFIPYLRANGVYDETTYNAFRTSSADNEWMPILGDIRKRYKKFCFQDINAKENAGYYETLEECDVAYEAIKQDTILELGGMVKVKKMLKSTFERKLEENINTRDSKIPSNKYLFYYDASKKNDD